MCITINPCCIRPNKYSLFINKHKAMVFININRIKITFIIIIIIIIIIMSTR